MNRRGRGRGERAGLTREAIVDGAVQLSRSSAEPMSVRNLAAELGVDPMAVHYWFRGRHALLDAAAAAVLEDTGEIRGGSDWEAAFRAVVAVVWEAVHGSPGLDWPHRDIEGSDEFTRFVERMARSLRDSGLPERDAAAAARALLDLARAHAGPAETPEETRAARVRSGAGLLLDGLRLRAIERHAAAGRP